MFPLPKYKLSKVTKLFSLLAVLIPYFLYSQAFKNSLDLASPEKVYLQLSSKVYAIDEEIWFKAIVTDAKHHTNEIYSSLLYVELIDAEGQIIDQKKLKLSMGIGYGSFLLNENLSDGRYLIRAYTRWNRNFGKDFIYESYINLISNTKDNTNKLIDSLLIVEDNSNNYLLKGRLLPESTSKSKSENLMVHLKWENGQDSFKIKAKKEPYYQFEHEINSRPDWISVSINEMGIRQKESIVLKNSIDLQFFPEGGRLIHGVHNKVGFKAIDVSGKGIFVKGGIYDQSEQLICSFDSNHLGMGVVSFQPDSNRTYHAKILSKDIQNDRIYALPPVMAKGSILSISRINKHIRLNVFSSLKTTDYIHIKISCRGVDYYLIEGPLKNGYLTKDFLAEKLPEGILVFTLMDKSMRPVSERLFFNSTSKHRLNFSLKSDKSLYTQREPLNIKVKRSQNETIASKADMSVLVINKKLWNITKFESIRSYFLLSSELRGAIEEPDFYFRGNESNRIEDLDALLLTQGWRNYKYPVQKTTQRFFRPENNISVNGHVISNNHKSSPKNINVSLITFGKNPSFYNAVTDSIGRFEFPLYNTSNREMRILLSAKDSTGNSNYNIVLNTTDPPAISFNHKPDFSETGFTIKAAKTLYRQRNISYQAMNLPNDVTALEEVVVSERRLTPLQLKLNKKYGAPDVIISGNEIKKKEKKWSYGLYSILLFNYGDQIEVENFSDGFMLAHIRGGRGEPTLLMADGRLLEKHEYDNVPHISPDIIERIELIKYAKFFKSHFLKVFPETNPLEAPPLGHIISIVTKEGKGIYASRKPQPGTIHSSIKVFDTVKEYYTPKYTTFSEKESDIGDYRSLIYWNPSISIQPGETKTIDFFNGDITGKHLIIVEMITEDGRIGYRELPYEVISKIP
ncbi:hypothetical protein SAMN04487906_1939 [Zhouia amylolytica]|uniref:MG2 domain-containing protein n=1 Tax=Zhouia amylolytica TaxID=376730 RepID=A0A1I6TA79_9FLAO|nr:hypothetical protein SAMN04487906_1939 [Zhouia amylolytica]